MMLVTTHDRFKLNSQREFTDEGYLKVPGYAARTGTQDYLAKELSLTDRKPNEIVKVYRPADAVFDPQSLESYDGKDITIEHPGELVNTDTYNGTSVGHVMRPAVRDGDFARVEMLIKDKRAIEEINKGKVQLSVGYTAVYDEAPSDAPWDYVQTDIKVNHVALVDVARAGPQARIFDNKPEEKTMNKVVLDSGRDVEIEDKATASLVADSIERLQAERDGLKATNDSLSEQLDEAKKATSDEAIKTRVSAVASTMKRACAVAGSGFTCDSVDPVEIKRAAMAKVRTKVDWADKSAAYVEAAFDAYEEMNDEDVEKMRKELEDMGVKAKDMSVEEMRKKMKDMKSKKSTDALADDLVDPQVTKDAEPSARDKYLAAKTGAFKGE